MYIIHHDAKSCQTATPSPLQLLHELDLADWEVEYHWWQFEELTLEAQRQLVLYDAAHRRRKRLKRAVSAALAPAAEDLP